MSLRPWRAAIAVAIVILATVLPGATPTTQTRADVGSTPRRSYGMHVGPLGIPEPTSALDQLRATGATLVPMHIIWEEIEPTPGWRDWQRTDGRVAAMTARGLTPYFTIGSVPKWASEAPHGYIRPDALDEWAQFNVDLADRYGPVTHYFSYFNEPDCTGWQAGYSSCWAKSPERYVEVLRLAHGAIKPRNPEINILMGGLAGENFFGNFDTNFLENVLKLGVTQYIDALDLHYYPNFRQDWEIYGTDVIGKVNYFRSILAKHNAGNVPLHVGEISLPAGRDHEGKPTAEGAEKQLRYVAQSLTRIASLDVHVVMWYSLVDPEPNDYGLMNGTPDTTLVAKTSYPAFQTSIRMLGNATAQSRLTAQQAGKDADKVEGYSFETEAGTQLWVVWSLDETTRTVSLPASANKIAMTTATGQATTEGLSSDKTVSVGPRPLYVEFTVSTGATPTATASATLTRTATPTPTSTKSPTVTSPTATASVSVTSTPSVSVTATRTASATTTRTAQSHRAYLPLLQRSGSIGW